MIGIIMNDGLSEEKNHIYYVYKNFYKIESCIHLIPLTNIEDIIKNINKCCGIIMQGGDDYLEIHKEIIKYLYDNDIPLLAICMSMQAMGVLFNGKLGYVSNHKSKNKYAHLIKIKKDTLLYDILGQDQIMVNSFHKEALIFTDLKVSAYSDYIEAIEDNKKKFFLGLQWHPEKMVEYDKLEMHIFDYFKEVCYGFKRVNKDN